MPLRGARGAAGGGGGGGGGGRAGAAARRGGGGGGGWAPEEPGLGRGRCGHGEGDLGRPDALGAVADDPEAGAPAAAVLRGRHAGGTAEGLRELRRLTVADAAGDLADAEPAEREEL